MLCSPQKTGKDLSEIAGGWSGKTWDFLGVKVLLLRYFELDEQIAPKYRRYQLYNKPTESKSSNKERDRQKGESSSSSKARGEKNR